ncbi:MAG: metallophosphoesterase family protein [Pseudonocardiaceae bacterium]
MGAAPDFEYLFRYRDLVADTLPEHRRTIEEKGFAWWGWWKRPNEPSHEEYWDRLANTVKQRKVTVGLFHSGTGQVHLAIVDRIIVPESDEYGNLVAVTPSGDEMQCVPHYYRQSSHSRAWFRLVSIDTEPTRFFGRYSFREAPQLPGYLPRQLRKLASKIILDADELRTMDTTIWRVRSSVAGDRSELILTANARTSYDSPHLARPVSCPGDWILHVTDPHFALGRFRQEHRWKLEVETESAGSTMFEAISSALRRDRRAIGAILLTGDLTFIASDAEFDAARTAIFRFVTGDLALGLEHLVVVPGNHDIAWTKNEATTYQPGAQVTVAPTDATRAYSHFYQKLYLHDPHEHLSMSRRFVFPGGNLVDVIGVNSSSLEQGKSFLAGMGRIQEAAYRTAASSLEWGSDEGLSLRLLALHHHLVLTEDLESADDFERGFGIAVDAARILRMAARDGVHIAVHGHKHRAFVWRTDVYELPESTHEVWDLGPINIVGGGSAGSTSVEGECNYFNLIRVCGPHVQLEMYRSKNSGEFSRFMSWNADIRLSEAGKRTVLSAWRKVSRE